MSQYIINGGVSLHGTVKAQGAKNAVLPILCATLLCDGEVVIKNCPDISDVHCTLEILNGFGCETSFSDGVITINSKNVHPYDIPQTLSGKLRSASLFLGASLGRFGKACQCTSGGCELGARPIDMHLKAFAKMGVIVLETDDCIICENTPHGTDVFLRYPSVGATENVILAAAKSKGTTTITNAAREPEITDLQNFINAMGGKIKGAGGSTVVIEGVPKLENVCYTVIGDRIETATFLAAALATDGEITVTDIDPNHLTAITDLIINAGGSVCRKDNSITARRGGKFLLPPDRIETAPYPGFPTDAQSVVMAMLLSVAGTFEITERVFSDRLRVVSELVKTGADIKVTGNTATIYGTDILYGATMFSCDLRSGAALVIAALSAKGRSTVCNISHIERGYENFDKKLRALGADIIKTED